MSVAKVMRAKEMCWMDAESGSEHSVKGESINKSCMKTFSAYDTRAKAPQHRHPG